MGLVMLELRQLFIGGLIFLSLASFPLEIPNKSHHSFQEWDMDVSHHVR